MPDEKNLHSRLRPMIGDHKVDGPDTVLVLEGFRDRAEIEEFVERMEVAGVFTPPAETN
jgi:hypothetical protein